MSKNRDLKELTLKIIGEKELSKKKLLEELRRTSNISDKTLNEILMSFLKDKKICITGYDFEVYSGIKRIQSIKSDGIVFGLIKTDPIEIDILIKQLESNNPVEVKDALYRLKIIFKRKIEQIGDTEKINVDDADEVFNKTILQIKSSPDDQKIVLRNKLALCLSSEKGSNGLFEHFIYYINSK